MLKEYSFVQIGRNVDITYTWALSDCEVYISVSMALT